MRNHPCCPLPPPLPAETAVTFSADLSICDHFLFFSGAAFVLMTPRPGPLLRHSIHFVLREEGPAVFASATPPHFNLTQYSLSNPLWNQYRRARFPRTNYSGRATLDPFMVCADRSSASLFPYLRTVGGSASPSFFQAHHFLTPPGPEKRRSAIPPHIEAPSLILL